MNKEDFLSELSTFVRSGVIKKEEVLDVINQNDIQVGISDISNSDDNKLTVTKILYIIGGIILITGIVSLVNMYWQQLNSIVKILITLGLSVASYTASVLIQNDNNYKLFSKVLKIISLLLLPVGLAVVSTLSDISSTVENIIYVIIFISVFILSIRDVDSLESDILKFIGGVLLPVTALIVLDNANIYVEIGMQSIITVSITALYAISLLFFRSRIFMVLTIIYATIALYATTGYFIKDLVNASLYNIYEYLTLSISISYLLISSVIKDTNYSGIKRILDVFGSIAFFASIFALGNYKPEQSIIWEIIGVISLIFGLYYSKITQNSIYLKITAIFVFIYIGKFTGEYFVNTLGWPLSLIISGTLIIVSATLLIKFRNRISK